jgi:hypothetical protein
LVGGFAAKPTLADIPTRHARFSILKNDLRIIVRESQSKKIKIQDSTSIINVSASAEVLMVPQNAHSLMSLWEIPSVKETVTWTVVAVPLSLFQPVGSLPAN